jgi:hypothetical protein
LEEHEGVVGDVAVGEGAEGEAGGENVGVG